MGKRQKYSLPNLRSKDYEIAETIPGERQIIKGKLNIDRACFKKTPAERLQLKIAKLSVD